MKKLMKTAALLLISFVSFTFAGCSKENEEKGRNVQKEVEEVIEEIIEDTVNVYQEKLVELNAVLETSFYSSILEIDNKGNVLRTDNSGNTFEYNLNDISEVKTNYDGFYNVLIVFKEGKFALTTISGVTTNQGMNVFAFDSFDNREKAKALFSEMIAK